MKKFIGLVFGALLLYGCATVPGQPPSGTQLDDIINQIIEGTAKSCQFLPDAANIGVLVAQFYPAASTAAGVVQAVVTAICQAPTAAGSVRRGVARYTRVVYTSH